jgi:hypothetical protein
LHRAAVDVLEWIWDRRVIRLETNAILKAVCHICHNVLELRRTRWECEEAGDPLASKRPGHQSGASGFVIVGSVIVPQIDRIVGNSTA